MVKIGSLGRFRLTIVSVVLLLTGALVALHWYAWANAAPAPLDLLPSGHVQFEAQAAEVEWELDARPVKEGGAAEWVEPGNPESIPLLIQYLQSQDEIVQLAALAEFAGMGKKAKKAVSAIVAALQDPKDPIRVSAAVTLIQMNSQTKAAISALAKELQSEDAAARARARNAIDQLVDPPDFGVSCWGPDPPPRVARPWVRRAVQQAMK